MQPVGEEYGEVRDNVIFSLFSPNDARFRQNFTAEGAYDWKEEAPKGHGNLGVGKMGPSRHEEFSIDDLIA
jgi:hypothetical protein